ncbi:MAG TPA: alpha/beta family hydrolase [Lysobacter sp.]
MTPVQQVSIAVDEERKVSGLLIAPSGARACYVLAHGAGAGMAHPFMAAIAEGLAARGVATLRYQFPYMERGSKRPDVPRLAQATVRAAVARAAELAPGMPLLAGGKSFGGRMTSKAQAVSPLPGVRGLAFLGFPLHPAGKPSDERAAHLLEVEVPMLFLQGTRDELAGQALMQATVERLGACGTAHWLENADHSFHVPARSGRRDAEVMAEAIDALVHWIDSTIAA